MKIASLLVCCFFFFNDTATTEIYTLSLHDALPISAGTELTAYRGTNPYLSRHWDVERRLFVDGEPTFSFPLDGWGYEQVGEIVEVGDGVAQVRPGDRVWGAWGHRSGSVVPAEPVAERVLVDACRRSSAS